MSETQQQTETETGFRAIVDTDPLEHFLDVAASLVDEAKIRPTDDGLSLRAVDPANAAMIDETLDPAAFESYDPGNEGVLGLNLERLQGVLDQVDSDAPIELAVDQETRKLRIRTEAVEVQQALIAPDSIRAEPDIPEMDLPVAVTLTGRDLSRITNLADLVSDHLTIGFDTEATAFTARATGDTDDVEISLGRDELVDIHEAGESVESLFSLGYVTDVVSPIAAGTDVSLTFGQEFPVKIRHSIAEDDGRVLAMVAPRLKNE